MTAPPVDRDLLEFALAVARRGGDLAAGKFFAAAVRTSLKPDGTEVTGTDLAVEDLIRAELQRHCPADGIYGEERGRVTGRGRGCRLRTGDGPARTPVLRPRTALRETRTEPVNPGTWHGGLLQTLHRSVTLTGYLGGVGGVLTGLLDAVVIAGFPMGYEDLAPLPVIMGEAGGRVTDLSGGPVLTGPGTALVSTGHRHLDLLNLVAGLPHREPAG